MIVPIHVHLSMSLFKYLLMYFNFRDKNGPLHKTLYLVFLGMLDEEDTGGDGGGGEGEALAAGGGGEEEMSIASR